ncbi:MAG: 3D domain-containing protein [Planctomycetes bacterium]|nr:3D domain-containing protein [Planctomycetota bacterium]
MRVMQHNHHGRAERGSVLIWTAASLLVAMTGVAGIRYYQSHATSPVNLMVVDSIADAATLPPVTTPIQRLAPAVAAPVAPAAPAIVAAPKPAIAQTAKPAATVAPARRRAAQPTFDNRPLRVARTITMVVTAYSPDARSCGKSADGITASGYSVWTNGMKMVAADTRLLPFGTLLTIPGYHGGKPVPVLDRGGAIKGNRLDLLFPTHEQARQFGRKTLTVTVWEYAD